jgi:hypothetical protein
MDTTNIIIRGCIDLHPDNPLIDRQLVTWRKSSPRKKYFYARTDSGVEREDYK